MVHQSLGRHHLESRKRLYKNLAIFPHKDKLRNFVNKFIYIMATIMPIFTITQVYKIWYYQNAAGVSIIAWSAYLFATIVWLTYGILHEEKPIIYSNAIAMVVNFVIVLGIIFYG